MIVNEQGKLLKAQRQLGALVYSLAKGKEENQPLVDKYIEMIDNIEQEIARLKASLTPGGSCRGGICGARGSSLPTSRKPLLPKLCRKSTKPARSAVLPSRTMHCSATSAVHSCNKTVQQQGGAPHRTPSCFCERKMQTKCGKFAHFVLQNCMRCDTIYSIFYKAGERCAGLAAKGTLYGRAAAGNSAYPCGTRRTAVRGIRYRPMLPSGRTFWKRPAKRWRPLMLTIRS